jgi:hypothetical protein
MGNPITGIRNIGITISELKGKKMPEMWELQQAQSDAELPPKRRHRADEGECEMCDRMRKEGRDFHPPHDASLNCQSRGHAHCSCRTCF